MDTKNNIILESKNSLSTFQVFENKYYSISYYLLTHPKKEICEDALLIYPDSSNSKILAAVCDGVGSSDRSYRAAQTILKNLAELPLDISTQDLEQELSNLNKKLMALEGSPQTTLTLVLLGNHKYTCAQVGDSGLIHCSNHGNLKYKSPIQSPVGKQLASGDITEKQALEHPDLHFVGNVLGCDDYYVEISDTQEIASNDTLFLTSDGILDNFVSDKIIELISKGNVEDAANNLITELGKELKKVDDISFICIKLK